MSGFSGGLGGSLIGGGCGSGGVRSKNDGSAVVGMFSIGMCFRCRLPAKGSRIDAEGGGASLWPALAHGVVVLEREISGSSETLSTSCRVIMGALAMMQTSLPSTSSFLAVISSAIL